MWDDFVDRSSQLSLKSYPSDNLWYYNVQSKFLSCEATFLLKLHLLHALICSSRWGVTGCVNRYTHEEVSEIPKVLEHFRKSAANNGLRVYGMIYKLRLSGRSSLIKSPFRTFGICQILHSFICHPAATIQIWSTDFLLVMQSMTPSWSNSPPENGLRGWLAYGRPIKRWD